MKRKCGNQAYMNHSVNSLTKWIGANFEATRERTRKVFEFGARRAEPGSSRDRNENRSQAENMEASIAFVT